MELLEKLLGAGPTAIMLAWFLWKLEPALKEIKCAINRQSQLFLILLDDVDDRHCDCGREAPRRSPSRAILSSLRKELERDLDQNGKVH